MSNQNQSKKDKIEKQLEIARRELSKLDSLMDRSHVIERAHALKHTVELENQEEPFPTGRDLLQDQHQFSEYEKTLQDLLTPFQQIANPKTKPKKTLKKKSKNPSKKRNKSKSAPKKLKEQIKKKKIKKKK